MTLRKFTGLEHASPRYVSLRREAFWLHSLRVLKQFHFFCSSFGLLQGFFQVTNHSYRKHGDDNQAVATLNGTTI